MSRLSYATVPNDDTPSYPAHAGDCIGARCPCSVLAKRLTVTQNVALAVMVLGIFGFVVGLAEHFGVF